MNITLRIFVYYIVTIISPFVIFKVDGWSPLGIIITLTIPVIVIITTLLIIGEHKVEKVKSIHNSCSLIIVFYLITMLFLK